MNKKFTDFSKGCQLCQHGKWLCIFITYKCTAGCHFCPAPFSDDRIYSAFGDNKEQVLEYLKKTEFEGISFSGGDPFLSYERMLEWLSFFKKRLPHYYYWVYTNGLSVSKANLKALANEGMDEIRFNIAATNYLSSKIWEKIKDAREIFSRLAIEVPSIQDDYEKLLTALEKAEKVGVDYLNLHDYIISEKELSQTTGPVRDFFFNKTTCLKYAALSVDNTNNVKKDVVLNNYNIIVNHCSMQQKEQQMLQRRLKTGAVFNNSVFDKVNHDGTITNYYYLPNSFHHEKIIDKIRTSGVINEIKQYIIPIDKARRKFNYVKKILEVKSIPIMEVGGDKLVLDVSVLPSG